MRLPLVLGSALVSLAAVGLATLVSDLSFSRAALLAPVLVLSAGGVMALLVLWGKAALEPWRRRRPR